MRVRQYNPADEQQLILLHAKQGLDYALPNLNDPLFAVRVLIEGENGKIVVAALGRITCEIYLLMDDSGTPQERWERVQVVSRVAEAQGVAMGFKDCQAQIPPQLEKRFKKRLFALGWQKRPWPLWSRELGV